MSNTKVLGIVTAPTLGGTDYMLTKITCKLEQEKIEYVAMGSSGGWTSTIAGGKKTLSGSFEGAADTTLLTGSYIPPFTDSGDVAFSITLGTKPIAFSAVITDVEIDKSNTGVVTIKGNYQADGPATFS